MYCPHVYCDAGSPLALVFRKAQLAARSGALETRRGDLWTVGDRYFEFAQLVLDRPNPRRKGRECDPVVRGIRCREPQEAQSPGEGPAF